MKYKIAFVILFIVSTGMMFKYAHQPLSSYSLTVEEKITDITGTGYNTKPLTKNYQDNYGAIGGAIGLGIIAAASLISFALITRRENK